MNEDILIQPRFCGPDHAGNGGYTAGIVAAPLRGPARVTLRAPAPLGTALTRVTTSTRVELRRGDQLLVEAVPAEPTIRDEEIPRVAPAGGPPALPENSHLFPRCFVCGPYRARGDGLRIMPAVESAAPGLVATTWTPSPSLANHGRELAQEFVWAALDCPGGWAFLTDPEAIVPMVLGRLTVRIDGPVVAGQPHTIVGWQRSIDGRKRSAGSAILLGDRVLARAEATWISIGGKFS